VAGFDKVYFDQVGFDVAAVTAKTSSDTGSGADAKVSYLASFFRSEVGSGIEALIGRAIALAELGSGIEHILDRALVLTDLGSGLDSTQQEKASSDSGVGSDAILGLLDRVFTEYGYGVDVSKFGDRPVLASEVGSGIESSLLRMLGEPKYSSDAGIGAESSLQAYLQKVTDSGVATEAIIFLTAIVASDIGQGVDEVLSYLRKLVDSGEGSEIVQLIGAVGRDMRLRLYARQHHNLIVYTEEK